MGYEFFYACLVGILMQYIMILVVKYIIVRKKRHKRKKCKRRILIAIGIIILMYLIGPMARFSSLENAANFYIGKENVGKIVVKGDKTALVFGHNNSLTYFFECKNGKWRLPEYSLDKIKYGYQEDKNNKHCSVETDRIGNEKGIYVILRDASLLWKYPSGQQCIEKIEDSEGSRFVFVKNEWNDGYFCTYLKEKPEKYSLKIDGYEVKVDWGELLNGEQ